jgi:transmembrane protein 216
MDEHQAAAKAKGGVFKGEPVALLSLQIFIVIEYWLQWVFLVVGSLLMMYKAYKYNYNEIHFWPELLGLWALSGMQFLRLFIGSKGNKTEKSGITVGFVFFTLGCIAAVAYFCFAQSYVIAVEFIGCAIIILLEVLQLVNAAYAAFEFRSVEGAA